MPHFVVDKIQNALNTKGKAIKGSKIHILGVAYKKNIDDMRESPALDIIHLLREKGGKLTYSDPYVSTLKIDGITLKALPVDSNCKSADCVVIVTDHRDFDYKAIEKSSKLIVDTRNGMKGIKSSKIIRL